MKTILCLALLTTPCFADEYATTSMLEEAAAGASFLALAAGLSGEATLDAINAAEQAAEE